MVDPLVPPVADDEPLSKAVAVQTKYRDSEAQTNPYTPDYILKQGTEEPEVLMLDKLTAADALPVGLAEVQMIELAREKRLLMSALPPITDEASLNLRKRLMEQQELREFGAREEEFDRMREQRISVLRRAIDERDAANEFLAEQRVEALRQRLVEGRDKVLAHIQTRRVKALRKLGKARASAKFPGGFNSRKGRAIIDEYADFGSKIYAPVRRDGQAVDNDGNRFDVLSRTQPKPGLEGVAAMERSIPAKMFKTKVIKPGKAKASNTAAERKALALTADLQLMDTVIKAATGEVEMDEEMAEIMPAASASWKTKTKRAERPATPVIEDKDEKEIEVVQALSLLQKLLRGRAVQNTMYEGKTRRIELIKELRASDGVKEDPADLEKPTKEERIAKVHQTAIDTMAGETASALFDFLAKDLVRKEEKDRIAEMAAKADAERRKREVEEGGKRQAEELVRDREDEAYRQVMRVHHAAAVSYVDELMISAIEKVVADIAMGIVKGGPAAEEVKVSQEIQETAKDLVSSFMQPSAAAIAGSQEKAKEEERMAAAAHATVEGAVDDVAKYSTV